MGDPVDSALEAALNAPITASLGPVGPLLRQLDSRSSRRRRPEGVSEADFLHLIQALKGLCISLNDAAKEEDPSITAKCWMKILRELCYDAENYLDQITHIDADPDPGAGCCAHLSPIHRKRKRRLQITNNYVLSELMARVNDATRMGENFNLCRETTRTCSDQAGVSGLGLSTPRVSLQLPVPTTPMEELAELLAFDDDKEKQLKVVTIIDFAGVGKTLVARSLYHKYSGKFKCRAFLQVSRNQDIRRLLTSILSQIKAPPAHAFSDAQDLLDSIRQHLQDKRYFVIVNDLLTTSVWNIISSAFPDGYCRSRIIITTQSKDVLMTPCSYLLKYTVSARGPINDGQPGKYDGVSNSEDDITPEEMRHAMNCAYNALPPYLKTCLLYLGMHTEGYTIMKDEVVKQWVAEGFCDVVDEPESQDTVRHGEVSRKNAEVIAGGYFDELVSRGMVEPVDTNYKDEVLSCTVHNMVLDLIRCKSMEDNFMTTVDPSESTAGFVDMVRRLSIQFGGAKGPQIPATIRTSKVRSLFFCGLSGSVPSIVEYRFLRVLVLHMWADKYEASVDLSEMCELPLLRYVKIVCNIMVNLPARIQGMKYLETLELHARVDSVPSDLTDLGYLWHLRLPGQASLPASIGRMTSLLSLGDFDLTSNSEVVLQELSRLINLQDLRLTSSTSQPVDLESKMERLCSVISTLGKLKSVTLVPADSSHGNTPDHAGDSSMSISSDSTSSESSAGQPCLQRLELSPWIFIFGRLPAWIAKFDSLCVLKIALRKLPREDADILKGLPSLAALSLYIWNIPAEMTFFGKEDFQALKYFKFTSTALSLRFAKGALPKVKKLKLRFNADTLEQYDPLLAGFEQLLGLEEISAKIGSSRAGESANKAAECASELKKVFTQHSKISNVQLVDYVFHSDKHKHDDSRTDLWCEPSLPPRPRNPVWEKKLMRSWGIKAAKTVLGVRYGIVKRQMRIIQREMQLMTIMIEENKEGDLPEKWILQLQELVYDMEDFINNYSRLSFGSPLLVFVRMKHLKVKARSLRNLAQTAKSSRGGVGSSTDAPGKYLSDEAPCCYTPEADLVGIEEPKKELVELLAEDVSNELRVISIVGCSGLGKSTLARAVYNDYPPYSYDTKFNCIAWIMASDCNSAGDLLKKILIEILKQAPQEGSKSTTRDDNLLRRTLENKRFFIVIDQLQRPEMWYGIVDAFPKYYHNGSRIIVTTSIQSVADAAATTTSSTGSYLYTMEGLRDADSKRLFWKKFYGRYTIPAPGLAEGSESIFRKCDGLPLALISTANYLRQRHRMDRIERLGSYTAVAPEALGEMKTAFVQCYNSLPDNGHRMCLLSLSMYPEGYQINRKSVIRRWVAEGLVAGDGVTNVEKVASDRFDELIDRHIIEQVQITNTFKLKRYQVRGVMLEFIVNKAICKNIVTLIRKDEVFPSQKGPRVRRLSVQDGTAASGRLATETGLSVIRSLTIFKSEVFCFRSCKLLRVLNLECCSGLDRTVLDKICELIFLKYLSMRGSDVGEIPKGIRKLHYLETLDLRETEVNTLPMEVIMLPLLAHLFGKFDLPQELKDGNKKSELEKFFSVKSRIQTLSGFIMDKNSGFVPLLLQIGLLRKVKIWCRNYSTVESEDLLVSSLNKCFNMSSALESLSIDLNNYSPGFLHFLKSPCVLSSFKLRGQLGTLPNFITSPETTLRKLQLTSTGLTSHDVSLLQKLPFLIYLKLYEDRWGFGDGVFDVKTNGFPSLEWLVIEAPKIPELDIKGGAMANLTSLHLLGPEYAPTRVQGITHLQHLNEVVLHDSVDADGLLAWKWTAMGHGNRPKVRKQATSS